MVNVTPSTPPTYPIEYTWGGNVYEIASLSGLGCADTVYSTTYNGTAYNTYAVLPPSEALQVIQAYEAQFGIGNIACSSLLQEANFATTGTSASSTSLSFLGMNLDSGVGIIEFLVFLAVLAIGIGVIVRVFEWALGKERRR